MCKHLDIIAICGLKRSGKDTLANYISSKYNYKHVKISSKLKEIVRCAFDLTEDDVESNKKDLIHPSMGVTPRRLMDFLGTRVFQYEIQNILPNIGRKFWIENLLSQKTTNESIVISDLRFHHEAEAIKSLFPNSMIIKIMKGSNQPDSTYVSETEVLDITSDYTIYNNGSIHEFTTQFDKILDQKVFID